jgi:hypothetical protein
MGSLVDTTLLTQLAGRDRIKCSGLKIGIPLEFDQEQWYLIAWWPVSLFLSYDDSSLGGGEYASIKMY